MDSNDLDPAFDRIFRQIDEGPIGSRKNCAAVLHLTKRVGFIFPYDGNPANPKLLPGGWISQNVYSELGWHPDEIQDDLEKFIHPDDRQWLLARDIDAVKLRVLRKDRGYRWALAEGTMGSNAMFGSFKVLRHPVRGFGKDSGHPFSIEK